VCVPKQQQSISLAALQDRAPDTFYVWQCELGRGRVVLHVATERLYTR
jgi:hypothetical protein